MKTSTHPALFLCAILLLPACDTEEPGDRIAPAGRVEADRQRPGDPARGYQAVLNNAYITCGIPYSAFQKAAAGSSPAYTLADRSEENRNLPYLLTGHTTPDGVKLVVSNCLLCHAAPVDGKLVIGLGNEFLDFTTDPRINAERIGTFVDNEADAGEWEKWADRVSAVAPYIITETVGMNPAINLTFALMAHRDPKTLAWSEQPLIAPPEGKPLPVSVPPWWRMRKKNALYYNAEGRGDHARSMFLATTLCTDSVEEARALDAWAPDVRAYLASIEAPGYPYPVDEALAQQGRAVFEQQCSRCHGRYGEQEAYPNLVIDIDEVGTDPELANYFVSAENLRFHNWFSQSFFGEIAWARPVAGYYAPPLDGIWATAPFLHNGSVPTLAALLDSSTRPAFWEYPRESRIFDQKQIGWEYRQLKAGKSAFTDRDARKRVYDTELKGYSNRGHTFGDGLDSDQRQALLEYLKTL